MNKIFRILFSFSVLFIAICCDAPGGNENTIVLMKTPLGDLKIRLYDDTPIHRDNFIRLVNSGIYDGVTFHRVISNFMIQGGDPATRSEHIPESSDSLNAFTIPAEFNRHHFHKKGALAAARHGNDINPEMRSSGTQFYIVQGIKLTNEDLDQAEQIINNNLKQTMFNKFLRQVADSSRTSGMMLSDGEIQEKASVKMFNYMTTNENYVIPEDQRLIYKNEGGVPRLDGTYTVFGEVLEGTEVIDRIAAVPTDKTDKPISDIRILKVKIDRK